MGKHAATSADALRRRHRWLPACGLLLALATVFLFAGEWGFYKDFDLLHSEMTAKNMALAKNLSARRGLLFISMWQLADGTMAYNLYGRFPIGTFVLIKLAIAPFAGDSAAQLVAARTLMLAFFCAAAALAYLALARLTGSRAVALGATLLAFSSHHLLYYSDVVSNEASVDLFAVMLVFHGMMLFHSGPGGGGGRRLPQLAAKVCAALLLGWHVYGLLLPFLVFGAAAEAAAAWRDSRGSGAVARRALGAAALRVARGRSALLGALALLFGASVLGYNLAREHAALGGQRVVAELPSVRSMLRRTGLAKNTGLAKAGSGGAEAREWPTFLRWQFHRVGVACLPVALAGGVELDEVALRASGKAWLFWPGVVATLGALAGLALFHRPRAPPAAPAAAAALALAGFCWAFLAPDNVAWAYHQHEGIFHIGVPLCLFAGLLLGARRLWRRAPAFSALAAVPVFGASSVAMDLPRVDEARRTEQTARMAEFDAIAETIQGKTVWFAAHRDDIYRGFPKQHFIISFLTAGGFAHWPRLGDIFDASAVGPSLDFVLAFERHDTPALLTPGHRFVFLYEAGDGLEAVRGAAHREYRRLRALAPLARTGFDIRALSSEDTGRVADELAYLKAPCLDDDTKGLFYLHLVPVDVDSAGQRPDSERRNYSYNSYGVTFDGKCMMRVPLPTWPVANVYTGQIHPAGDAASWRTAFRLDVDRLRGVLRMARRAAPSARGAFDLHLRPSLRRRRGAALLYVREPCTSDDVRRPFFLHIVPVAAAALPAARRRSGFANLDFEFSEHGALVDDACVATVELPDYDIARVHTGQVAPDQGGGEAWRVELAPHSHPPSATAEH